MRSTRGAFPAAFLAVVLSASFLIVSAEPAVACSCGPPPIRDALAEADGAFVGALVERIDGGPPVPFWGDAVVTLRFAVEADLKGNLDDPVDVVTGDNGASCGMGAAIDRRIGVLLTLTDDGIWTASSCSVVDPDALLEAAEPLPPPDGEGPIRLLVGGDFGEVRTLALDAQGRTLAYGYGDDATLAVDACPGGDRMVETVTDDRAASIVVRDLATLEVLREVPLVEARFPSPYVVSCLDPEAARIAVVDDLRKNLRVHVIEGDVDAIVFEAPGRAWGSVIEDGIAELKVRGGEYVRLAVPSGEVLARVPLSARVFAPRMSPDGRWIAGVRYGGARKGSPPSDIVVMPTRGGDPVTERLGGWNDGGWVRWLSEDRLLFLPTGEEMIRLSVFRVPTFRELRGVDGWYAGLSARVHGVDYGIVSGALFAADLGADRHTRLIRELEGHAYAIAGVPGATEAAP